MHSKLDPQTVSFIKSVLFDHFRSVASEEKILKIKASHEKILEKQREIFNLKMETRDIIFTDFN